MVVKDYGEGGPQVNGNSTTLFGARPVSDTATMLGLAGFVVIAAVDVGDELEVMVRSGQRDDFCRSCGARAVLHDRRPHWVRDLPAGGRPVRLCWVKNVWRCESVSLSGARCAPRTWTETSAHIKARAVLTERAKAEAARRVGRDADSVEQVRRDYGVGWHTVMRGVVEHGAPLVAEAARLAAVSHLGVDETVFLSANHEHPTLFVTGMVDTRPAGGGPARLLDVVEHRSGRAVTDWLDARGKAWRDGIDVAALDPFRGYDTALRGRLDNATIVLDCFHATKLGIDAVDQVRRRVQNETLGHRGRRGDPLYGIRRVLRRGAERLTGTQYERLLTALAVGDPHGEVSRAWIAMQTLRHVYGAHDERQARDRLHRFYVAAADAGSPEIERLARTIESWQSQLLAYFTTGGASNGPTEAVNLLIKRIKRVGFGFRNFANYRLRLLLHCGVSWNNSLTPRMRTRAPRFVA